MCLGWGGGWCYGDAESIADDDLKRGKWDVRVALSRVEVEEYVWGWGGVRKGCECGDEGRYSLHLFWEITNIQVILHNWNTNKQLVNGITNEGEWLLLGACFGWSSGWGTELAKKGRGSSVEELQCLFVRERWSENFLGLWRRSCRRMHLEEPHRWDWECLKIIS